MLPSIVHLRAEGEGSVLQAAIHMLDHETRERRLGASLVTHHVAQIMLVQSLRQIAASPDRPAMGWLAALADPRIGAALQLMHEQIDRRWTVNDLAREAGMSRSIFALRFKQLTGSAPLDYLLRLRMRMACQALQTGERNVAEVAYESRPDTDFGAVVGAMLKKGPDSLLFVAGAIDVARLAQQARRQAPTLPIGASEWAASEQLITLPMTDSTEMTSEFQKKVPKENLRPVQPRQ